jgi:hypothetical protein
VDEWVVTIMHFDGDRIVREWVGADKLGLFIQLGVVDNRGPASCQVSLADQVPGASARGSGGIMPPA